MVRRSFLNKLWVCLGIVAFIELLGVITAYLYPRRKKSRTDDTAVVMEAGSADKFALNSVTAFLRGKFYLCRLEDGGFLAISRTCTHLGCTVPWVERDKRFACPCHASAFDIKGEVINPPAHRPLDIYYLFIENNIVKVDTGKRIKRNQFNKNQVVYVKKV